MLRLSGGVRVRPSREVRDGWIRRAAVLLTVAALSWEVYVWLGWKVSHDLISGFQHAVRTGDPVRGPTGGHR
jgi:hypothetical protein